MFKRERKEIKRKEVEREYLEKNSILGGERIEFFESSSEEK